MSCSVEVKGVEPSATLTASTFLRRSWFWWVRQLFLCVRPIVAQQLGLGVLLPFGRGHTCLLLEKVITRRHKKSWPTSRFDEKLPWLKLIDPHGICRFKLAHGGT